MKGFFFGYSNRNNVFGEADYLNPLICSNRYYSNPRKYSTSNLTPNPLAPFGQ